MIYYHLLEGFDGVWTVIQSESKCGPWVPWPCCFLSLEEALARARELNV